MWRKLLWVVPLIPLACTGLHLDNGNNFPCDYTLGPGARDEACQPGDICGTNNLCQPFIYEGPRFEGKATVPTYGPASGEGDVLHPLVLKSPAQQVTAVVPLSRGATAIFQTSDGIFRVGSGHIDSNPVTLPMLLPSFGNPILYQPFFPDPGPVTTSAMIVRSDLKKLAVARMGRVDVVMNGASAFESNGVRVFEKLPNPPMLPLLPSAAPVAWDDTSLGLVEQRGPGWDFTPLFSDPGVFDVAAITLPMRQWLLVLKADAIEVIDHNNLDAGIAVAAELEAFGAGGQLKTDPGSRVVAAVRRGPPTMPDVLSTFQVTIGSEGPTLSSPWPDCRPCRVGRPDLVVPSVRSGAPTVDVLCRTPPTNMKPDGELHPFRVIGSVALTQFDSCLTEALEPSIDLEQLQNANDGGVVSWGSQAGLLLGGKSGELWSGDSLTTLEPMFLDRVPLDVAPASAGAVSSVAVITDEYLAVQQTPQTLGPMEQLNGFRRLPQGDLEDTKLMAFIHGVNGWAVTDEGELLGLNLDGTGLPELLHGAQLVTANEDPIRSTIGGEGFTATDGGLLAFFVAADDSLYFASNPENPADPILTPVLTPEPSTPIRSLALERTPLGTNGIDRAAGYLLTSRNVYAWKLSGTPARWSSTPLVLTAGEPMEVWFDSPHSALGRVGYRDGQIYSLPGGYLLAEALPEGQVIDFENLGGWPVAYATSGLYIAGWEQVDGKLQNRFPNGVNMPMTWRRVTIAGTNTEPWMDEELGAKSGKLFVAVDPKVNTGDGGTQLHRLLLFNDTEVRQVARHQRNVILK